MRTADLTPYLKPGYRQSDKLEAMVTYVANVPCPACGHGNTTSKGVHNAMARTSISKVARERFTNKLALKYAASFNPVSGAKETALRDVAQLKENMSIAGYADAAIAEMDAAAREQVGYTDAEPAASPKS